MFQGLEFLHGEQLVKLKVHNNIVCLHFIVFTLEFISNQTTLNVFETNVLVGEIHG
jgi:hypothetical protein